MKISQMLKRESFYQISDATLFKYFSLIYKRDFKVRTCSECKGKSNFFVYPHINAIVSAHPNKDVRSFIYREFSVSSNFLRRLITSTYTRVLLNSRGVFAKKCVNITPELKETSSCLIYPGNRRIRIFHFNKGYVDVILKNGFPSIFFEKDIEFRIAHLNLSFVLPIIKYNDIWFREPIIDGVPLARILDKKLYNHIILNVYQYLDLFQSESVNYIELYKYLDFLLKKITEKSERLEKKLPDFNFKRDLEHFVLYIAGRLKTSVKVPLCLSHGDFQAGNVIVERGTNKIYIIDWETWGKRSAWYDQILLTYMLRQRRTFFRNLKHYVLGNLNTKIPHRFDKLRTINVESKEERQQIIGLFLLEDILWQIEETENFPDEIKGFGFNFYVNTSIQNKVKQIYE